MEQLIRNPGNCNGAVRYETRTSKLLPELGGSPNFSLRFIRRNANPAARSPWLVLNLNSTFERMFEAYLQQDAWDKLKQEYTRFPSVTVLEQGKFIKQPYQDSLARRLSWRYSRQLGPLEASKANTVVSQVLDAVAYLHTNEYIVHGDICSYNVLVDVAFTSVRLCGFKETPEGTVNSKGVAIGLWTAPEILDKKVEKCVESDVFSFGMLVYEMLTTMPPHTFPGIRTECIRAPKAVIDMRNAQFASKIGMSLTWKPRPFARMSTAPLPRHLLPENRCPDRYKQKLNYACLGTRPLIPNSEALNEDYNDLIALFYVCTEPNYKIRPSVTQLLYAWLKVVQ